MTRRGGAIILGVAVPLLAACAHDAPKLPPDLSTLPRTERLLAGDQQDIAFALLCSDMQLAIAENGARITDDLNVIQSRRGQNQTALYVGVMFFPPVLAALNDNSAEQAEIDVLKTRRDVLFRIAQAHECEIPDSPPLPTFAADDVRWEPIVAAALGSMAQSQSGSTNRESHYVHGYIRKDGTYVTPYHATNPNGTKTDNYSTIGNVNPYTGKPGTKKADQP
jgi:hypothetical protein